ncbi:MAG: RnfABCDGE type electron transport complex subunit D [Deferribacteraceae bacterium]|jgi:electron transport complex protein RnfD|nr:RnfABCDGE type electron transport complex subunit D [Deferribacteraceae bacterium]
MADKLLLSVSPHIHSGVTSRKLMRMVYLSLLPAIAVSGAVFGMKAVFLHLITIFSCVVFESLFNRITGRPDSISDGSAVLTGTLLAMSLPVSVPLWIAVTGSFVSIVIAKMVFGGLGGNPFNPALVGRIFLLISFPVQMTAFAAPSIDAMSGATVLGAAKTYIQSNDGSIDGFQIPELWNLFTGFTTGSLGETSVIAILAGGIFLMCMRIISWHIPVTFIGTVFLLTFGHIMAHPGTILPPLVHLMSGGLMLGAFYMATDYVTSPLYTKGKLIFGAGCGVITVVIRLYGGYPEGVAFAILIMNAVTPLLDRYLRPKAYGEGR